MDETMKEIQKVQAKCTHHVRKIKEPPYRYVCVKCGKKQKLANGLLLDEFEARAAAIARRE